jgi:hypothetical protein
MEQYTFVPAVGPTGALGALGGAFRRPFTSDAALQRLPWWPRLAGRATVVARPLACAAGANTSKNPPARAARPKAVFAATSPIQSWPLVQPLGAPLVRPLGGPLVRPLGAPLVRPVGLPLVRPLGPSVGWWDWSRAGGGKGDGALLLALNQIPSNIYLGDSIGLDLASFLDLPRASQQRFLPVLTAEFLESRGYETAVAKRIAKYLSTYDVADLDPAKQ